MTRNDSTEADQRALRILDLFSGTGSVTHELASRGHEVITLDITDDFGSVDLVMDVRTFAANMRLHLPDGWVPDHVHASPPCQGFSVPSIGRMWEKDAGGKGVHLPKHPTSELGMELLQTTLKVLNELTRWKPNLSWIIENPNGMMRKVMPEPWASYLTPISYCQYGPIGPCEVAQGPEYVWAQKATDFWTNLDHFDARRCLNRPPKAKSAEIEVMGHSMLFTLTPDGHAYHERAKRGSVAGIQRIKGADARAMFPVQLGHAIADAVEAQHQGDTP